MDKFTLTMNDLRSAAKQSKNFEPVTYLEVYHSSWIGDQSDVSKLIKYRVEKGLAVYSLPIEDTEVPA